MSDRRAPQEHEPAADAWAEHFDEHDPEHGHGHDHEHEGYWHQFEHHDQLDDHDTRSGRRSSRRRPRRGAARALRRLLVLLLAVGLVAAAAVAALAVLKPALSGFGGDNDYPGPGSGSVQVVVNPGDTGRSIGETLFKAGVVKTSKAFADAAAANPASAGIQPGAYTLKQQMKAADAVSWLADPANRTVPMVTIREGLWKSETFAALSKATGVPVADYEKAAKDPAAIGLPAAANGNVEGYLFPATYEFAPKSTPTEQLRMMVQKGLGEMAKLGITPQDMEKTVVTASIVEAEGRIQADRAKIARVIDNRLAQNMRLQLDSTVSYGLQKRAITTTDAQRADAGNLWNTYAHDGLPVGPIGNPGLTSLQAAVAPADGPWMFFVTVNPTTGETKFAETLAEHDQYVAEFQAWCNANKGQC